MSARMDGPEYDVFISYRWVSPDQDWVRECLFPALLQAGLRPLLDVEDFVPGRDLILEMTRAGQISKRALCVLSPEYFDGNRMVGFEALAARRMDPAGMDSKLVPLLLRKTHLPEWIRGLVPVDWTDERHRSREWRKLLRLLGAKNPEASPPPAMPVHMEALSAATSANGRTSPPSALLAVEAKDGAVYFGEQKYTANGAFTVEVNFYVLPADQSVALLAISGHYLAYGCPSLPASSGSARLNGRAVAASYDGELESSFRIASHERALVSYRRRFRPPLMNTEPVDCDGGDMEVRIEWRLLAEAKTRTISAILRLERNGRGLALAEGPRLPPKASDEELRAWYEAGRLSAEELEALLAVDPVTRYMQAFSSNRTSWVGAGVAYSHVKLLRKLVGNPHELEP